MANVKVEWVLPTTRESGKPLQLGQIDYVEIFMSADGGVNYGSAGKFEVDTLSTVVNDLEPGEWFFGGVVVDTAGKPSKMVKNSITLPDTTPPSGLSSLTLVLE